MANFTDAPFMTAEDKAKVLRQWEIFLKHGCQEKNFTDRLYKHLTLHCAFIAHFNREGFYAYYFTTGDAMARFLSQFNGLGNRSIEYGILDWTLGDCLDLNSEMCMVGAKYIPHLLELAANTQKLSDIAAATYLLGKHGLDFTIKEKKDV